MRTVTNPGNLADKYTSPVYLVQLWFEPAMYLSSGGEVDWNGTTWRASSLRVNNLTFDSAGRANTSVRIQNVDRVIGSVLLDQPARDRKVDIWLGYPDAGIDFYKLFTGSMDGSRITREEASITVRESTVFYGSSPRMVIGKPLCNHLPQAGQQIKWGGDTLTLRSR